MDKRRISKSTSKKVSDEENRKVDEAAERLAGLFVEQILLEKLTRKDSEQA